MSKRRWETIAAALVVLLVGGGSFYYLQVSGVPPCPSSSVQGFALYVKVITDNTNATISGAQVTATFHDFRECVQTSVVGGTTMSSSLTYSTTVQLPAQSTQENGSVTIVPAYVGNYSITIQYEGQTFNTVANVHPIWATLLTVSLPSGKANQTYINE